MDCMCMLNLHVHVAPHLPLLTLSAATEGGDTVMLVMASAAGCVQDQCIIQFSDTWPKQQLTAYVIAHI